MISKLQLTEYFLKLWNNPEHHVSRFDLFMLLNKVGQDEMKDGDGNWHNLVCNTFQFLLNVPGPLSPINLCRSKSYLSSANERAKERMTDLMNETFFGKVKAKVAAKKWKRNLQPKLKLIKMTRIRLLNLAEKFLLHCALQFGMTLPKILDYAFVAKENPLPWLILNAGTW